MSFLIEDVQYIYFFFIEIAGLHIEREHCNIYCEDGVVQLIPKDAAMCTVNGAIVTEPTELTQGQSYVT